MAPSFAQVAISVLCLGSSVFADSNVLVAPRLEKRYAEVLDTRVVKAAALPGTWTYQGCYTDPGPRTLAQNGYTNTTLMTTESCIAFCDNLGYIYAGTEYSSECYCGSVIAPTGAVAAAGDCELSCSGNTTEICGGHDRLSIYWNGQTPPAGPSTNPGTLGYGSLGCWSEGTTGRSLVNGGQVTGAMTVALCIKACKTAGYKLAGVEFGGECYCDNNLQNGAVVAPGGLSDCNTLCNGNQTEYCGAGNRLNVYQLGYTGTVSSSSSSLSSTKTSSSSSTKPLSSTSSTKSSTSTKSSSSSTKSSTSSVKPSTTSSTKTTSSSKSSSTSSTKSSSSTKTSSSTSTKPSSTSTKSTSSSSSSKSSTSIKPTTTATSTSRSSTSTKPTSTTVSSTSSKSSSSSSSASSKVSSLSTTSTVLSSSSSSSLAPAYTSLSHKPTIGSYYYYGCYQEGNGVRALSGKATYDYVGMTLESCAASCAGFTYWGVEYGGECYCGNTLDATSLVATNGPSDCSFVCPGQAYEYCGAGNLLEMYKFGTAPVSSTSSSSLPSSSSSTSISVSKPSSTASSSASSMKTSSTSSSSVSISKRETTSVSTSTSSVLSSSSISTSAKPTPTAPGNVSPIANYIYLGCYTEATGIRALSGGATAADTMTVEVCQAYCAGYTYFGMEYGRECYCGNSINTAQGSVSAPESDCSDVCMGNKWEFCGQGNRLSVYVKNGTAPQPTVTGSSSTSSAVSGATGIPKGWSYDGCYSEGNPGRALSNQRPDSQTNSVEVCINACAGLGYKVAGMEYGTQCFCDNFLYNGAAPAAQTSCNMPCPGNTAETCGAGNFLDIYHTGNLTAYKAPTAQKTDLPGSWQYQGCYADNVNGRALFWQSILTNNNTATSCLSLCAEYGFMAAGMEYGDECYCGDEAKLIASGSTIQPETDCQVPCSGNTQYFCGGGARLSYYKWVGNPIYTFGHPTGNNAGSYQYLIGGVVIPLITTVGINNKVVFMEKSGTGAPNTTGTYELDLTFINDVTKAWRPLHVTSDIFCSAGITLPDKAGRQLNIGGWAGASTYGVRLYWPDGSPGTAGVNDWQENNDEVSLLAGRWYPSAMIMANGSVLVLGGEVGSNAAPTPSCEILPPPAGGYAKYLDWLDRTDPDNLYPFMFVLPSGGIFVVYYNEARVIDDSTFDTIKTLPNMPGSVVNFLAGRTYPLEGTGVMMPQYPPYSEPVEILVCGGSANGAAYAIDNCVSTKPEVAKPTWTIERMPTQRVLSCICALPDGTYLILNGAQEGVGGFGLAQDPNYQAVLYDPSLPVNKRMSLMATTIVARLYHSEAILLPDGRVLVSGSNPEDGVHPEEYRVEVFNPPYSLSAAAAPTFSLINNNNDWDYSQTITVNVNIPSGNLNAYSAASKTGVRASMMAAVSSTHGNSMGQRTLFLNIHNCNGATCQLDTPPSARVATPGWYQIFILDGPKPSSSHWIRIGGLIADAAGIGNWPAEADFKKPGLGAVTVQT